MPARAPAMPSCFPARKTCRRAVKRFSGATVCSTTMRCRATSEFQGLGAWWRRWGTRRRRGYPAGACWRLGLLEDGVRERAVEVAGDREPAGAQAEGGRLVGGGCQGTDLRQRALAAHADERFPRLDAAD